MIADTATSPPADGGCARAPRSGLGWRLMSAAILAPIVILATIQGGTIFDLLVVATGALMAREWGRLAEGGRTGSSTILLATAVIAAVLATVAGAPLMAMAVGVVVATGALYLFGRARRIDAPIWLAAGVVAISVPCAALDWLRADPAQGMAAILWLFAVVWTTDTGAYVCGRAIGGPKLAPRVSPNKTWAGLLGGMLAAAVLATLAASGLGIAAGWPMAALAAGLALMAQVGDLMESVLKRHFDVKDTGRLIPGHGGVLDRCDGLLTTAPALALVAWVAGRPIFPWI